MAYRKVFARIVVDVIVNVEEGVDFNEEVIDNLDVTVDSPEADMSDFTVVSHEITDSK